MSFRYFTVFTVSLEEKRFADLTFSSPSKMFFSPAQEAGFSVKNIFFSEENVRRGPAPSGTSSGSICIFVPGV